MDVQIDRFRKIKTEDTHDRFCINHISSGYQVKIAEYLKQQTGLPTITVGLITEPHHAEEILCNERADLVALGRALLREPYWVMNAARALDVPYDWPEPYQRGYKTRK